MGICVEKDKGKRIKEKGKRERQDKIRE